MYTVRSFLMLLNLPRFVLYHLEIKFKLLFFSMKTLMSSYLFATKFHELIITLLMQVSAGIKSPKDFSSQ